MKPVSTRRRTKLKDPPEAKRFLDVQMELIDFEELIAKFCLKDLTPRERAERARKPLYLRRYE